ncbi:MAG TPA: CUAEP/CCAEP-tail radical SAM protein [Ktedonobacteraceae bacterium]|nr:CUAEP/CCAEP-tail radical SAM protein [Ktedonobacteraceae bacterium]
MKQPGNILLISCYELGHQPQHLAMLSTMLQRAGYYPVPVDTAIEALSDEAILHARFVAIAVPMHTALRLGQNVAKRVRKLNPTAHICFYGLYALLNADYLLREHIDSAIGGEYEEPLLRLISALEQEEPLTLPGVFTRQSSSGPWIQRTAYVTPQRHQLPSLEQYARLERNGIAMLAGYTETTRGCKHTCLHCPITPIYNGRFFAVPADIVLSDIRTQIAQGARHITFGDPDFLNGPTHALRITRALHSEFPDVTFDATIKVEHLLKYRHLLPELKANGCAFIVSAVESLNENVLRHLDKGHTSEDVATVFAIMEQVGIPLRPSLMPFSPWETLDSYIALLSFFEEQHLIEHVDPVHFSIRLLVPPGSALLDSPDSQHWLGELDATAFTYRWHHPDPRMDELQRNIAQLVEQAERNKVNPIETFFSIQALALAARGEGLALSALSNAIASYGTRNILPHLTESWFC